MTGMMRLTFAAALLALSPAAAAKIKSADDLKPDKAYLLVQVDPVEFKMMGNNRLVTGVVFAPYDAVKKEIRAGVMVRNDPVAKDGKRRLYLIEVDPGTWVIAGTGASGATLGSADTSFSLGSYHFEVGAGELADLGVFVPLREESDNPDTKMTGGKLIGMAFFGGGVEPVPNRITIRPRGSGDIVVPSWLAAKPLVQPAFIYGGTFGNQGGGLVNRIDGKDGRGRAAGETAYLSKPGQPAAAAAVAEPAPEPVPTPPSRP
ncbi:hypothetical protein [Sphingopyxis sp.]|uniref:hypothetical protein n=1 Tax=Sphingopyxis sp. TaxID=1908224 RepID=UPI003D110D64